MANEEQPAAPAGETTTPRSADERRSLLARALQTQVVEGGRIESQSDFSAVVVQGHRVNHVLHLVLTLITFGLWAVVWIALVFIGGEKRRMVSVDEFGNTLVQRL